MQKYNLQKNPQKQTKILQDIIITMITNLKFQHKPKYGSFKKKPHIKIDQGYLLLLRGQKSLKLTNICTL